jgi:hypothetical protein
MAGHDVRPVVGLDPLGQVGRQRNTHQQLANGILV